MARAYTTNALGQTVAQDDLGSWRIYVPGSEKLGRFAKGPPATPASPTTATQTGGPTMATTPSGQLPEPSFLKRNASRLILAGVVLVVLLIGGYYLLMQGSHPSAPPLDKPDVPVLSSSSEPSSELTPSESSSAPPDEASSEAPPDTSSELPPISSSEELLDLGIVYYDSPEGRDEEMKSCPADMNPLDKENFRIASFYEYSGWLHDQCGVDTKLTEVVVEEPELTDEDSQQLLDLLLQQSGVVLFGQ